MHEINVLRHADVYLYSGEIWRSWANAVKRNEGRPGLYQKAALIVECPEKVCVGPVVWLCVGPTAVKVWELGNNSSSRTIR